MSNTLHIAVQLSDANNKYHGYRFIADHINDLDFRPLSLMAEESGDALKERVRQRIIAHPEERWLILSGTVLAEVASPPVRFRAL